MSIPIVLAHGALGNFDELIFLGIVAIFLTLMGISWVRGRNVQPNFDRPVDNPPSEAESPERFKLD